MCPERADMAEGCRGCGAPPGEACDEDVPPVLLSSEAAIVRRLEDPYVETRLPGVRLLCEVDVSARTLRPALDKLLERAGARRVSVVITSLEPL